MDIWLPTVLKLCDQGRLEVVYGRKVEFETDLLTTTVTRQSGRIDGWWFCVVVVDAGSQLVTFNEGDVRRGGRAERRPRDHEDECKNADYHA